MTREELKAVWKSEEDVAHIRGWDFSHIHGRYEEEESYPWDYAKIIRSYLTDDMKLLDIQLMYRAADDSDSSNSASGDSDDSDSDE